jgi:integrase
MALEQSFRAHDGRTLRCPEGQDRVEFIERPTKLRLRVSRTGARTWAVMFWSPAAKKNRRLKLGDAGRMPLATARKLARAALHRVESEGVDVFAEARAQREREREQRRQRSEQRRRAAAERTRGHVTFDQLVNLYVEHRRTTPSGRFNRVASRNTLSNWGSFQDRYITPVIGRREPSSLTSGDFIAVLEKAVAEGGPTMGPRLREFLSAIWRWAEPRAAARGWAWPATSPLSAGDQLRQIGRADTSRERTLSPAELWHLWRATEGDAEAGFLRFALLTASRVKEASALPWSEVDLAAKRWTLPAERAKGARVRVVPLSDAALRVLQAARGASREFVFGNPLPSAVMVRVRSRMKAAMGRAFRDFQPRDLRRTAATRIGILGFDPFLISAVLDHARLDPNMAAVTQTYLRTRYESRVSEALAKLGEWVTRTAASKRAPGEAVDFERRAVTRH